MSLRLSPQCTNDVCQCPHWNCDECHFEPSPPEIQIQEEGYGPGQRRTEGLYDPEHHAALSDFSSLVPVQAHAKAAEPQLVNPAHTPLAEPPLITRPDIGVPSLLLDTTESISPQSLIAHPQSWYASETVFSEQAGSSSGCYDSSLATPFPDDQSYLPTATKNISANGASGSFYDEISTSTHATSGDDVVRNIAALHRCRDQVLPPQDTCSSLASPRPIQGIIDTGAIKNLDAHSEDPPRSPPARPAGRRKSRAHRPGADTIPDSMRDRRFLTCPFVWYDPVAYRKCLQYELERIRDVKQHLRRKHMKPLFCGRCKVVFADEAGLKKHSEQPQHCEVRVVKEPDGITTGQRECLADYPKDRNDVVAQWNTIWNVVFPSHPDLRPHSPFTDESRPEAIASLVAFFQKELRPILMRDRRTRHVVEEVLAGALLGVGAWEAAMRPGQQPLHRAPTEALLLPPDAAGGRALGGGPCAGGAVQHGRRAQWTFVLGGQASCVAPWNDDFGWGSSGVGKVVPG